MADSETTEVYEQMAEQWAAARTPVHQEAIGWLNRNRQEGPIIDVGTGPGWHLAPCVSPAIGLDVAASMLELARQRTDHPVVLGSADALPFRFGGAGGAIASRVYNHLGLDQNPAALADLHRSLAVDAPVLFEFLLIPDGAEPSNRRGLEGRSGPPFEGRLFSMWERDALADTLEGAGFQIVDEDVDIGPTADGCLTIRARRRFSLPDTVGPGMRLLICGLNPSPTSSETGVGFGRPGNRFWPAAAAAGLVTVDRDPRHALRHHRIGMTDLVKRTTRRADELSTSEYQSGLARVERLVRWLQPQAICFVGLAGWRAVVDKKATPGPQPEGLGGRPVYVMPSTSGLNASSRLDDLVGHLIAAAELADSSDIGNEVGTVV